MKDTHSGGVGDITDTTAADYRWFDGATNEASCVYGWAFSSRYVAGSNVASSTAMYLGNTGNLEDCDDSGSCSGTPRPLCEYVPGKGGGSLRWNLV